MQTESRPVLVTEQDNQRFCDLLEELKKIKDQVEHTKDWFKDHAKQPMLWFRTTGVLLILFSVSIPFLGTLEGFWRSVVLPVVALAIAGLTGINSFFQFQSQWQGYRQTQFSLEYLIAKWEIEIIEAKYQLDKEKAIELAMKATARLLEQAREVTASETGEFFKGIQLPAIKPLS